jgi:spermidine synthase
MPPPGSRTVRSLVLVFGAGAMISQVLILRELLVLAQGQELKLALGLWGWLLWVGLGSLGGGRLHLPGASGAGPGRLGGLTALLGLLLPATILASRALPSLVHLPLGQSLPLSTTFMLFVILLAPTGLVSGYFFPNAVQVLSAAAPQEAAGRAYYLETLGAALGVALLQLFLVGRYANLSLGLAVGLGLALAPWLLVRPRSRAARAALTLNFLLLAAALLAAPRLEPLSRTWQWPGRQVIATVDSPYALLSASREAEQISFFANNLWQFTYPDPLTAEHQVQLGLLEHPEPRRVLLLGGGVAGLGGEILKTRTVTELTYVELDPSLVRLAQGLLPAVADLSRDPRVHLIYQDARRFIETTNQRYDVILMALPEPKSAQLNRFYTREFYRLVVRKLLPGGVFSFALPGAETSLSPLRAAYLAMAYHTLGQVFAEVVAFPGGQVRFFASAGPGVLVSDPAVLVRRLKQRHLALQYVREYYLLQDLSPWRRQYLNQVLGQSPPAVNTDLNPRCYFFDLVLSAVQEGLGVKEALLALQKLPPAVPLGGPDPGHGIDRGRSPPPPRSPRPLPGGGDGAGDHVPGNPGTGPVPDQTGFPLSAVGGAHRGLHGRDGGGQRGGLALDRPGPGRSAPPGGAAGGPGGPGRIPGPLAARGYHRGGARLGVLDPDRIRPGAGGSGLRRRRDLRRERRPLA